MATQALSGKDGTVVIGSAVSEALDWEIDLTCEALLATSYDSSGWDEFVSGIKGGSGTFKSLNARIAVGAANATFAIASGPSIAGAIIITNYKPGVPVAGLVGYEYTFNFNGQIVSS